MAVSAPLVVERLAVVRRRIEAAGGTPDVRVVAVTKGFGPDAVHAAVAAGVSDLGENYADELLAKSAAAGTGDSGPRRWHFLGRVQRNKVRRVAGLVSMWHGLDRVAAGREIAARAPGAAVLVQVNVSGEEQKSGCGFDQAPALVDDLRRLGLDVRGLMAVGPTGPPELARPGYRRLARLAERLGLGERSMGMTDDLEVAVEEGSTIVRVGRALFGARSGANEVRR